MTLAPELTCPTASSGAKAARLRQAEDILYLLTSPAILLDDACRIVSTNPAGRQIVQLHPAFFEERGHLCLRRSEEAERMTKAMDDVATRREHSSVITLKSRSGRPVLLLHFSAVDFIPRGIILRIEDLQSQILDIDRLANLMGLTPSQARVAAHLAQGLTIPEIAALVGRRETTLRTHVREAIDRLNLSGQQHLAICTLRMARFVGLMTTPVPPPEPARVEHE